MPDKVLRQPFSPPTSGAAHDFSNFKVLVVDDSRTLRLILSESLAALGIRNITLANDGEKALARLQEEHFDLMLLDMEMPEMDGLEVLLTLRAEGALHSMSVIVISGISALDRAYKCRNWGR
jgi:CheY-like chemotaxis protein